MDLGLPAMDGYEVATRLRQEASCRETILIAVTGYGMPDDLQRSRTAGVDQAMPRRA
jgi:two-component system CheB/CheR fusion protein